MINRRVVLGFDVAIDNKQTPDLATIGKTLVALDGEA